MNKNASVPANAVNFNGTFFIANNNKNITGRSEIIRMPFFNFTILTYSNTDNIIRLTINGINSIILYKKECVSIFILNSG